MPRSMFGTIPPLGSRLSLLCRAGLSLANRGAALKRVFLDNDGSPLTQRTTQPGAAGS
jgi:hypothetical protein